MWSFDVFALNDVSGDHALKFVFYDLLTRYDLINRFKVSASYHNGNRKSIQSLTLMFDLHFFVFPPSCIVLRQVPVSALMSFLDSLEAGYSKHKNPYHNLMHAADVTQTIHYLLLKTGMVVRSVVTLFSCSLDSWHIYEAVNSHFPEVAFFSLSALANWAGDLCHHFCSCHPWLWTHRDHQ